MLLLILAALATVAHADEYEIIRARERALQQPAAHFLPSIIASANASVATLNASCFWPDINYQDQTRANWQAIIHLSRITTLVQATTTPGSAAFEDARLMAGLHCALEAWLNHSPRLSNPNWWYRWIGEEIALQGTFLLLGANRTTPSEYASLVAFSYSSAWWINSYGGGDNLSDMLRIQLWRGIASSNATAVQQAFDMLYSTARMGHVTDTPTYEGPVDDASYHFHGIQLLNSAYGQGWVSTLLATLSTAAGTQWAMPDAAVAVLARFLVEGDLALTFGRRWDYGTQGRGIDRPGLAFSWGFDSAALRQLAASGPAAQPWATGLLEFAGLMDGQAATTTATSSKHFWSSDFYAHKRPTWGASFKGYGDNGLWTVVGNECDNSENILGEYTGAGVLNVYASAELDGAVESYGGIFPLWDWVRINGVTAEARAPTVCNSAKSSDWVVQNTAFVGGASDGRSGAVAHDFHLHNLTGQRSFFFLDDCILALASNLTSRSALPVRTALASRLLPSPAADARGHVAVGFANGTLLPSLPDGSWSFAAGEVAWFNGGGVGALLDARTPIALEVGMAHGDYSTIGPFHGAVSGRLFTATQQHGSGLGGVAAGYTLLPNASAGAMPGAAAAAGGVTCSSTVAQQGQALHVAVAAGEAGGLLVGAVAWERSGGAFAGCSGVASMGAFSITGDAIVLLRYNATHATATASHPALWAAGQARGLAQARALRPGAGGACAGQTITLSLPPAGPLMGSSVTVACELA